MSLFLALSQYLLTRLPHLNKRERRTRTHRVNEVRLCALTLLPSIAVEDTNIAAYSCGVVGLLMKRFPTHARALEGECCSQIERGPDNYRQVLCAEQLLLQCPWALCESSITPDIATHGGSRRRLFSRMLSWLPVAAAGTLKPLLCAFLALCSCDGTAQHGDGSRGNVEGRHGALPSEDLRRAANEQRGEFLFSMTTGQPCDATLCPNIVLQSDIRTNSREHAEHTTSC